MRSTIWFYLIILLSGLFFLMCQSKIKTKSVEINSFSDIQNNFQNPPADYRTVPFMVWHDKVSKEEIDFYLEDYQAKGFGGVFIHPRYGLITEYLSDEWFDLVKYTVDKAKSLNLKAWIYDENSFPSGFAGGLVPAEMPESYNKGQGLVLHKDLNVLQDSTKNILFIFKKLDSQFIEVARTEIPAGTSDAEYYLFELIQYGKSKWYGGYSYVDLLYPGVTEKFIEITMKGYEKSIGTEFGKTVPGVFTDEPNIRQPQGRNCIRWTPDLFEKFKERWGYDLKPLLPALVEEVDDWQRIRHNYYALLLELFIDRWSKPWYEYTEKHNLDWTGHYWEHGWPSPEDGSDNMAMYAWHQMPGIDMLFNSIEGRPDQFGNIRAVKELRSVANQMGRQRTLSETYGAAGWELRLEDMKRLGDWEYVLGVNFMNQHLSYMTLKGDRKHDFPQSFSYHTPWWNFYKPLADYYGRLSMVLAAGEQKNHILIFEPTTTAWMYFSTVKSQVQLDSIHHQFHDFLKILEQQPIEYDLGCENIIKNHGKIEENKFIVGKCAYDLVVFPPGLENLDLGTVQLLEKYLENGGKILSYVEAPTYIDGDAVEVFKSLVSRFKDQWIRVDDVQSTESLQLLQEANFEVPAASHIGGELFHQRRQFADGQILFLTNFSLKESSKGTLKIAGAQVAELDALDGKIYDYPVEKAGNLLKLNFNVPPAGSLLFFIHKSQAPVVGKVKFRGTSERRIETANELKINREAPNALVLDYVDLKLGDTVERGLYFYAAGNKIWQHHGFPDNPWVSSSQFKTELVDKDNFSPDTGFEVIYSFELEAGVDLASLRAVIEQPRLWQVIVNGQKLDPVKGKWWLDKSFGVFDIGQLVQPGMNSITLITKPMSIYAELEPIFITGNFNLKSQAKGWKIVPATQPATGSWKQQGMPYYPYSLNYQKKYELTPDATAHYLVKAGIWAGTVMEVRVNNQPAGIIGWQPYQLDITEHLKSGENTIELLVYGSLKNLLGPHHNVRNRGIVTPWSFKYAPEVQPAGEQYDLDNYGLFEDFQVVEIR